jgi:hypothetical protein
VCAVVLKSDSDQMGQADTGEHNILFDCEEIYVMEQRSESDLFSFQRAPRNTSRSFLQFSHQDISKSSHQMGQADTGEHILFDCEEIYVMEQRSESDLNNPHHQPPNNEDNLVHLLEDPENWSTICHFFN